MKKYISIGIIAGFLIAAALHSITIVRSGNVGVLYVMGAIQDDTYSPGFHLKVPFITSVKKVNVQTQMIEASASAASKDLQTISTAVAVNYHVDPLNAANLYRQVGKTYEQTIIAPAIQESVSNK